MNKVERSTESRMPGPDKRNFRDMEAEFEEDDESPLRYGPGDIGNLLKPALKELVEHRTTGSKRQHLMGFIEWVPPETMEGFLILCVEYGADKVMPKRKPKVVIDAQAGKSS